MVGLGSRPGLTREPYSAAKTPAANKMQLAEAYGKLPLSFEANHGQADSQVKFLSRGNGYTLLLTATETVLALRKPAFPAVREGSGNGGVTADVMRMKLVGANPSPRVTGLEELLGKSNYFLGNDPQKWRTNVPITPRCSTRTFIPAWTWFTTATRDN